MKTERRELLGRLLAVAAACTFATMGIWSVFFYEHGGEPTSLLLSASAAAAAVFWQIVLVRRARHWPRGFAIRAFGLGALQLDAAWGLLEGFAHAPVSLAVLLFYVYPLVATVAAWRFLGEELTVRRLILLGVGLAGIALAVGVPGSASAAGIGLGLLAGFCLGLVVVGSRHLLVKYQQGPFDLLPFMWAGPTVFLTIIALTRGVDFPSDAAGWWYAAGSCSSRRSCPRSCSTRLYGGYARARPRSWGRRSRSSPYCWRLPNFDLSGMAAVVTGASSGIAAEIARQVAGSGARTVLVARNEERLAEVAGEIRADGGECITLSVDVTGDDAPDRIVKAALDAFGALNILVNGAGVYVWGPYAEMPVETFDTQWSTNVRAPYRLTQAALPHLKPDGVVVNISSIAGIGGFPESVAYCATKGRGHEYDQGDGHGTRPPRRAGQCNRARRDRHTDERRAVQEPGLHPVRNRADACRPARIPGRRRSDTLLPHGPPYHYKRGRTRLPLWVRSA